MMSLTVLIAEDDSAMMQVIKKAVSDVPGVKVVGDAENGNLALQMFEDLRPQVVIIDIDLPGKNGLSLAQDIFDIDPWTYLVFCTGFAEYRAKAFELYAFDYLVKPFKLDRIAQTMNRILDAEKRRTEDSVIDELPVKKRASIEGTRLFRDSDKILMLNLKDVIFFTKEDRKTVAYYNGGKVVAEETLGVLEEQLKDKMFFRAHKGFLINMSMIREFIPCGKTTYQVVMANTNQKPLMTWDKLRELDEMMKERP